MRLNEAPVDSAAQEDKYTGKDWLEYVSVGVPVDFAVEKEVK